VSTTISPIRLRLLGEMVAHLAQGFAPRPYIILWRHDMSRPKRARNVTSRIDIRVTDEEKATLFVQANRAALTLSEYIRRAALGIRIRSRIHTDAISEMNHLGGLQKHCLEQLKVLGNDGDLRHELNITLAAIREQVKNVISLHIEEE
jgi:hypothetical protein